MATPVRLQLSRRKGFNLQALSRETNGLEAVNVARPSPWGNPYKVGDPHPYALPDIQPMDAESCANLYALEIATANLLCDGGATDELRGKNLACWCRIGAPCHADRLLDLANPHPGKVRT